MRNAKRTLALVAVSVAAMIAAPMLHAQDAREPTGSMMRGGMMGNGSMMGQMGRMMDHCAGMMGGSRGDDRPNDQWRKKAPTAPDKDG